MTPDLMEQGAQRLSEHSARAARGKTESGGRAASYGRVAEAGVDLTKKESILASLRVFAEYVDELDALMQ